jgi:hypothetical protein
MRPILDPSKYILPHGDSAIQGMRLLTQAQQEATRGLREDMAGFQERRQREQMMRAQMAERELARKELGQRYDQKMGLAREQFEAGRDDKQHERGETQQKLSAEAADRLMGALASGNLNDLERARSQAQTRDPSLSVLLPGEKAPAVGPTPSVDDVYPDDDALDSVRMSRGGRQLYQSPTSGVARQREADVASRLVSPFAGTQWGGVGVDAGGAGITGEKAAEIATKGYNAQEGRDAAERAAQARMQAQKDMHEQSVQDRQGDPYKLHDRVEKMAAAFQPQLRKVDDQDSQLSLAEAQLAQDSNGFMQNKAMAGILKAYTGAAATESERAGDQQGTGMWNYYQALVGKWADGGQLPPDFQKQVQEMLGHARQHNVKQRNDLGMRARDHVYASRSLPIGSARELAEFGNQAFTSITGQSLTDEELDQEAGELEKKYPGRFGGSPSGRGAPPAYDEASMQSGSGAAGNLGVTNGGKTLRPSVRGQQVAPPPGSVEDDPELDDLLNQMGEYAQP